MADDGRAFDLDQQSRNGEARDPDDRLRRMLGTAGDIVDRRRDRLVFGWVERVDRSADNVVPRRPGGLQRRLDVPHRRPRLLAEIIEDSQSERGPRVSMNVGISAFPENGGSSEALLEAAEEAAWGAKAAGEVAQIAGTASLQDR